MQYRWSSMLAELMARPLHVMFGWLKASRRAAVCPPGGEAFPIDVSRLESRVLLDAVPLGDMLLENPAEAAAGEALAEHVWPAVEGGAGVLPLAPGPAASAEPASVAKGKDNQPPVVNDESLVLFSDQAIGVPPPGLLANDFDPDAPAPPPLVKGAVLEYDAAADTDGNGRWEDTTEVTGFDFALGPTVKRVEQAVTDRPGITAAYVFDGASAADTASLQKLPGDPTQGSATFEFWFRPVSDGDHDVLFETGGGVQGMSFSLDGSTLEFKVLDAGSNDAADPVALQVSAPNIRADEFTQVVGIVDTDAGAIALFINGDFAGAAANPELDDWAGISGTGLGQVHGGSNTAPAGRFEGEIAQLRFYDRALAPAEVQQNFQAVAEGLKIISVSGPGGETAEIIAVRPDGAFAYDPNGQFDALAPGQTADSGFTYVVQDGEGGTATGTVSLTILGVNDPPVAVADQYVVPSGEPLVIADPSEGLLGNDGDPESQPLTVLFVKSEPVKGEVHVRPDGTFVYVPDPGAVSFDRFRYVVGDGVTASEATVTILIHPGLPGPPLDPPNGDFEEPVEPPAEPPGGNDGVRGEPGPGVPPPDDPDDPSTSSKSDSAGDDQDSRPDTVVRPRPNHTELLAVADRPSSGLATTLTSERRAARTFELDAEPARALILGASSEDADALPAPAEPLYFVAQAGAFWNALDEITELADQEARVQVAEAVSVLAVTGTLSAAYAVWAMRGTYLLGLLFTQVPLWRMVDPLPIFDAHAAGRGDDGEDESLASMIENSNAGGEA